jgi:membrane-bound metal-dependent hydrolase YbcI (DUF457 family)
MFLGHYAVAFAAKKAAPKVSLGTLFLSVQFVDLVWPLFLLLGLEHVRLDPGNTVVTPLDFYDYPFTHSLVGAFLWALLLGGVYFLIRRSARNAVIVGAASLSHWFLDLLVHRPDLPLAPQSSTMFGFGLWNSFASTVIVEVALAAIGIWMYLRTTVAKDRIGSVGFWGLVVVLGGIYAGNLFGPPPPEVSAIAIAGNGMWLFVAWAYWVDKHRDIR